MKALRQHIVTGVVLAGFLTVIPCRAGNFYLDLSNDQAHPVKGPAIESGTSQGGTISQHRERIIPEMRISDLLADEGIDVVSESGLSGLSADEYCFWKYGTPETGGTVHKAVRPNAGPPRAVVTHRQNIRPDVKSLPLIPREYLTGGAPRPADLFEWYDIRLILSTWVGMWMTETDAIPGALVNVRF